MFDIWALDMQRDRLCSWRGPALGVCPRWRAQIWAAPADFDVSGIRRHVLRRAQEPNRGLTRLLEAMTLEPFIEAACRRIYHEWEETGCSRYTRALSK